MWKLKESSIRCQCVLCMLRQMAVLMRISNDLQPDAMSKVTSCGGRGEITQI